jgi:hypothetical protein
LYGAPGGPSVELRREATSDKRGQDEVEPAGPSVAKRVRQDDEPGLVISSPPVATPDPAHTGADAGTAAAAAAAVPAPIPPQSPTNSQTIDQVEVIRGLEARVTSLEVTMLRLSEDNKVLSKYFDALCEKIVKSLVLGNDIIGIVTELKGLVHDQLEKKKSD